MQRVRLSGCKRPLACAEIAFSRYRRAASPNEKGGIEFTRADIVRSGICAMWVNAFEEAKL